MGVAARIAGLVLLLIAATLVGHCMNHTTGFYDTHKHEAPEWLP